MRLDFKTEDHIFLASSVLRVVSCDRRDRLPGMLSIAGQPVVKSTNSVLRHLLKNPMLTDDREKGSTADPIKTVQSVGFVVLYIDLLSLQHAIDPKSV